MGQGRIETSDQEDKIALELGGPGARILDDTVTLWREDVSAGSQTNFLTSLHKDKTWELDLFSVRSFLGPPVQVF